MLPPTIVRMVALFAGLVLLVVGNSMLGTIAALRMEIKGIQAGVIGIVLAMTSLGFVLGTIHAVRIVVRVGHIRAFAVFGAMAAAAALLHPLYVSIPAWLLFRLALGFGVAGLMVVTESWVNGHATAESRGKLLATYMVLFFLAASGGQFVVALGDPGLFRLFVIAGIFIVLSLVPVSLTRFAPPAMERSGRMPLAELWRRSELGLTGAAVTGVILGAFGTVGPVYAYEMGLDVDEVGAFMGIAILAAMAAQWPIGSLSDHLPRRVVVVVVAGSAMAVALLVAAFAHRSALRLYGGVAVFYALASCIYPLCLAFTHDAIARTQVVPASATLLLANGVGGVAGPVAGGLAISLLGPRGLFLLLAGALAILLLVAVRSFARESAPEVNAQSHCVGIAPVSTQVIMELDPRRN